MNLIVIYDYLTISVTLEPLASIKVEVVVEAFIRCYVYFYGFLYLIVSN
jgi:hypothetical protein